MRTWGTVTYLPEEFHAASSYFTPKKGTEWGMLATRETTFEYKPRFAGLQSNIVVRGVFFWPSYGKEYGPLASLTLLRKAIMFLCLMRVVV